MAKLSEINRQNPWWKHGEKFVNFEPRLTSDKFFERKEIQLKRGGACMLRGPRQVGKTTYLYDTIRKLLKNGAHAKDVIYLSLDFFTSRRELRNTLENFAQSTSDAGIVYIFLDEITSLDDWHLELKYMADQRLTEKAAIIVTGSNPAGMKERSDRIPGRGLEGNEYFIKPLSFRQFAIQSNEYLRRFIVTKNREFHASLEKLGEILPKKKIDLEMERVDLLGAVNAVAPFHSEIGYLFELYLTCGGYPAVINDYLKKRLDENRDEIDKRAGEVIIKDILDDLDRMERSKTIARDILRSVVSRYGSRYSFSNLSREIERNHPTTINYLECLEGSFLLFVFMAYDFARNMIKAKGDKKVYFFDPFVYHAVNGYLEGREVTELFKEARGNEEIIGKIVEGVVVSHLLLHKEIPYLKERETYLWHYYDRSGKKIDALFKKRDKNLGIEVKYGSAIRETRKFPLINEYLILSKNDLDLEKSVIPVGIFLALLEPSERNL